MPQPAAEPDRNSEAAKIAAAALSDAVKSIPAYVERADLCVVTAPNCTYYASVIRS